MLATILLTASLLGPASVVDERPISDAERDHWAFRPVARPRLPEAPKGFAIRNPIDAFIDAGLADAGIEPAPEASRLTLLRRLSFDLTGLPPTPDEARAFVDDARPDAGDRLVDRLLASPAYGERQAQHWLDLARYADTDGFEFDQARPDAWRYRDWVVNALNRDMPYDQFVRLQVAGDEIAPNEPDAFIATGFNRCYPDMVDLNDQALRRQNALNDITDTVGLAFLGLTVGCARCHDHKFDPIRQVDYYRLQAFFGNARFRDAYPVVGPAERVAHEQLRGDWETRVAAIQSALIALEAPARSLRGEIPPGATDAVVAAIRTPAADRTPGEVALVYDALARDKRIQETTYRIVLGSPGLIARALLLERLAAARRDVPWPLPSASGLLSDPAMKAPTDLLRRGDFALKGPEVAPGFPAVLEPPDARCAVDPARLNRRTVLARWLTDPANPLTARVMVNRIWQGHFGRGLVATPSDFGTQGAGPTHPELLDWLASEFVVRGWSLKALHRLIVSSAAYRRDSRGASGLAADPGNDLLWRQNRRRLDGEAIRDAMLAVSGRLNPAMGGPCALPELPVELTALSSKGAVWPVSPRPDDRNRRSLYVFTRRNLRYPFFEVFDRPDTNASCARRSASTVAPQSLAMLNGRLARATARALADGLASRVPTDAARVDRVFRLALGRPPDRDEAEMAGRFLATGDPRAFEEFCLAVLNLSEFLTVD